MEEKKYISISEYATIKGISKQAVYKQLNNKLKKFVVMVENKKMLDIAVLTAEELNQVEQPLNQVEQPLNNQFQPLFEKELEEKNKTIESLLRQIENLQEQNSRLTELLSNSQYLLAAEQKKALEPIQQQQDIEQKPIETTPSAEPKEKKGFLWRLRSKTNKY